jgi:hypothetical protein
MKEMGEMKTLKRLSSDFRLPQLDANGGVALSMQLETTADKLNKQAKLPTTISAACGVMASDREVLQGRAGALGAIDGSPVIKKVDVVLDNSWGAFRDWLASWGRLPAGIAEGEMARSIHQQVFASDGLGFTQLKAIEERAASATHLRVIDDQKLGKSIASLGGATILQHVRDSHQKYSDTIDGETGSSESSGVREAYDNLIEAMQMYAVKVMATVERDKPETADRAEALLQPIVDWKVAHHSGKAPAAPAPVPTPTPTATPK